MIILQGISFEEFYSRIESIIEIKLEERFPKKLKKNGLPKYLFNPKRGL